MAGNLNTGTLNTIFKICFTSALLFLYFTLALRAENTEALNTANEIYTEILSPYCPGRALKDCPSSAAVELKNQILDSLKLGMSKEEILNQLYQKFGEQINANPKNEGFGRLAWYLPPIFFALGLLIYVAFLRFSNKNCDSGKSKSETQKDDLLKNITIDDKSNSEIDRLL